MKHRYLAAAAIVAIAVAPEAMAQTAVGAVSAVRNDVRLRGPGGGIARPVQLRQRIALADQIQTGARSQLQILLLDRSVFTMGANARLTIDRFVYDPARNSRNMGATVTRGAFRFMSGRRTTGNTQINTPAATIGVRGTILEGVTGEDAALIANGERGIGRGVRSDPETATLIVLRGPGPNTQGNARPGMIDVSAGGRTVTVSIAMQAVYIPREGAAPIVFTLSNAGLFQLLALIQPSVADRLGLQGPVDPDRTFAPPAEIEPAPGPRRFPRRPGSPGDPPVGALPDDDGPGSGPPGFGTLPQLPLGGQGTFQPPPPRQRGRPAPTATPAPQQSPPPPPPPQPNAPNRTVGPGNPPPPPPPPPPPSFTAAPTPTPTPAPTFSPNAPNQGPPPNQGPRPTPTPTPTPGPGKIPG